jgi:hypothetical protein
MGRANFGMLEVNLLTVLKYVIAFSPFGMRSRRSASLALMSIVTPLSRQFPANSNAKRLTNQEHTFWMLPRRGHCYLSIPVGFPVPRGKSSAWSHVYEQGKRYVRWQRSFS